MNIPINRLKHCYMVGKTMEYCAKELGYDTDFQQQMFLLGYNHDAMYDFETEDRKHDVIVSGMLQGTSFEKPLTYHSAIQTKHQSVSLDLLYFADQIVDGFGNVVSFNDQIQDILNRHGKDDGVYQETIDMVEYLRKKPECVELESKCSKYFAE